MKILAGKVVSNKMSKTLVVAVERKTLHPLYKKIVKKTKRFKVHYDTGDIKIGDLVQIVATKPISKEKHFKILEKSRGK